MRKRSTRFGWSSAAGPSATVTELRVALFDVERYFGDAPLMIVGEGTNETQRNVIAAQLVRRGCL